MLDKIMLNTNRTEATLFFTNRPKFTLYCNSNKVELLVLDFISPIGSNNKYSNYSSISHYISSNFEDTAEIKLDKIS